MKNTELRDGSLRSPLLDYVKKKYKTTPDYPWERDRESAVLRHEDNRKWYGLLMIVEKAKLGISGGGCADVLNVKVDDHMFHDMLVQRDGYLPGYHMNRRLWITILLDGTVPFDEICGLIDASYVATASKEKKQKRRPPEE